MTSSNLRSPSLKLGQKQPFLLYGTAFKRERTAEFTKIALELGFQGIDTANQPSAYREAFAGDGLSAAIDAGIKREALFIQSKFTPIRGHDKDKIPFNPDQSIEGQIRESISQSLQHLKLDYLDALILHCPFEDDADNLVAWKVFETYVPSTVRHLGVSNISLPVLRQIYEEATVKPVIVQNRFFKGTGYDFEVRAFAQEHGILYQTFGVLKNNPHLLASGLVASVAEKLNLEKELALYVLVLGLGDVQILDGTTSPDRMKNDLKTIAEVTNDDRLLKDLAPSFKSFPLLLEKSV